VAAQLGIGRSTLYRLVGNRDDLLGVVLAEATERTFRRAAAGATAEGGVDLVLDVINRFMHAVIDAEPLQTLCMREPLMFIRLALLPGVVEQIAAKLIAEMLQTEVTAGRLEASLPATTLSQAIVRMCDAHLYAPLLGGTAVTVALWASAFVAIRSAGGHSRRMRSRWGRLLGARSPSEWCGCLAVVAGRLGQPGPEFWARGCSGSGCI
jgi:AcrR family transcriptional regulator